MTDADPAEEVDALAAVGRELRRKSTTRRIIEGVGSLTVVAIIFVFVIPKVTGSQYSEIWDELTTLDATQIAILTAIWALAMLAYTGVLTNTLPGLTRPRALTVNFAGSAVSNTLPFGGAVGVGATYAIDLSWGFDVPSVTLSILVSGVWNIFAKLGLPVIALVMLVMSGTSTGRLIVPTIIGSVALVIAVVVLAMVLRSDRLATAVGRLGQKIVDIAFQLIRRDARPDVVRAVLDFRHHSIRLVRRRWRSITAWIVTFNLMQYLLLFACVRALGVDGVTWAEIFAAFAFARLLETVPITPSGVGFVEAGAASALIAFGGGDTASTAAVFLYRGFVYLLEIPVGAIAWGVWASMRGWRRPIGSAVTPP